MNPLVVTNMHLPLLKLAKRGKDTFGPGSRSFQTSFTGALRPTVKVADVRDSSTTFLRVSLLQRLPPSVGNASVYSCKQTLSWPFAERVLRPHMDRGTCMCEVLQHRFINLQTHRNPQYSTETPVLMR